MDLTISEIIKYLVKEVWRRKVLVTFLYVFTSLVFLIAALLWPKVYTSSSTIYVDEQNILRPLMEGTAETTGAKGKVKAAREVVFSRESMERILASSIWFDAQPDAQEKDQMAESIKNRTEFTNIGKNLILISFKDSQPKRSFDTVNLMANIFIDESLRAKREESKNAYDFINGQASEYHRKLKDAELAIKNFRSKNVEASPSAELASDERLLSLRRKLETVSLELDEAKTGLEAMGKQLSGESGTMNAGSIARETQLDVRIDELEVKLADLRLIYMDSYPDIVQLKNQKTALKQQIDSVVQARHSGSLSGNTELKDGPIAQELRRDILRSRTLITTLISRQNHLNSLVIRERETKDQINAVKAEVAELTRDYDVNQKMYQRLLSQRENAYISMNIDIKNQGLTIKIQESASLPVNPKGIRFAHIILVGLVLSFVFPIGVVYGLSIIDRKIRTIQVITDELELPILAAVYSVRTPSQRKSELISLTLMLLVVASVWALYGYRIFLRMTGEA